MQISDKNARVSACKSQPMSDEATVIALENFVVSLLMWERGAMPLVLAHLQIKGMMRLFLT